MKSQNKKKISAQKPSERTEKRALPPKKKTHLGDVIRTPSGTIEENVEEQSP
ncbi:hypothetical protein [Bdellovibrio bacteriovorus]|uniref:hypothetical protein n=1 Tax=Bdellovibrio TaxID=958 RepID=UPI0035A89BEC